MKYYYIKRKKLYARGENLFDNYIYKDGKWIKDTKNIVSDRLLGYDPSEPPDSPYGFGNTDMMDDIEEITEEEFKRRISLIIRENFGIK